jgi:adenine deaminase
MMREHWHRTFVSLVSISVAAIVFSQEASAQDQAADSTLIKNVKIFDGVSGQLTTGNVLIENNLIKSIGTDLPAPPSSTVRAAR